MPEGIEKDVPVEELADVVSYLQSFKMTPKSFPGNQPQLAPVRDDGSFRLFAIHARIYGPSLVYEPVFRNLGYWQSQQDLAAWDVKIQRSGKYRIYMTYACEPNSAGNRYVFSVQGQSITGIIDSTGGWDKYGGKTIGTVELTAGTSEIVMRSDGPIRGALCDLKVIRLIPAGS